MATLNTRKPTGRPPWPTILVEGDEKAGKSWLCAEFTGSKRTGQAYWIDLAEGAGDEYASLGDYLYVVHDGTFGSIYGQIVAAKDEAKRAADAGEPPVVLVVDGINALWDSLRDWITQRARQSKSAKAILAKDPNAEIKPATYLWNEANDRWNRIVNHLITFPGIVLITARGKEVAVMGADGNPVPNQKDWRVMTQKELGFQVTAWLRMFREADPVVVGVRSTNTDIGFRPGSKAPEPLPADWDLDWFIFDALQVDPQNTQVRDFKPIDAGTDLPDGMTYVSPQDFLQKVANAWEDATTLEELYRETVTRGIVTADVVLPTGQSYVLGEFIQERGMELLAAKQQAGQQRQPQPPTRQEPASPPAEEAPPAADQAAHEPPAESGLEERMRELTQKALDATRRDQLVALWNENKDVLDVVLPVRGDKFRELMIARQHAIAQEAAAS